MDRKKAIEIVRKTYPHVGTNGSEFEAALRELVPELKESGDERIRKALVKTFEKKLEIGFEWTEFGIPNRSVLDWLERQKEQKPEIKYVYPIFTVGDIIKPKAYNESHRIDKIKDDKYVLDNGFTFPIVGQDMWEIVEQKPVEWSNDFEENIRILLHDKLTRHSNDGKTSSTVSIDDKTLKDIICGIWFYVGKEALKYPNKELNISEWSEEDEKCIKDIIICLEYLKREDTERQWNGDRNVDPKRYEGMITKLNSLRPQPKKEWTIKDAKPGDILHTSSTASSKTFIFKGIRNDKRGSVECFCCYDSEDGFVKGEEELIGWKTDKYRLATPEECIELGRIMGRAGYIFHFETNQLQKLDKLHWKPSEEQMDALEHFIRSWGESGTMSPQNTILCAANSLLTDLKKLP